MANLILVGFMGTGKTTVGRILAQRMHRTLVDMDEMIEKREGRPISSIFADSGEGYFRKVEADLVQELSHKDNQVIATGGGVVLNPQNIQTFRKNGYIFVLWATLDHILERTAGRHHRPLIETQNRKETIQKLLQDREPYYCDAGLKVDTTTRPARDVAEEVYWQFQNLISKDGTSTNLPPAPK